jgi:hypothetical protein
VTLARYEQELEALAKRREHMRTLIAWWTLLEERGLSEIEQYHGSLVLKYMVAGHLLGRAYDRGIRTQVDETGVQQRAPLS